MFIDDTRPPDARAALLAEVEFKWLMAGRGCWIDMTRFGRDPGYAAHWLRFAMASQSAPLRACAEVLQARAGLAAPWAVADGRADHVDCKGA